MLPRGRKYDNDTVDVINKGCFDNYDTLACVRMGLLTTVAAITLFCVAFKIIKYHVFRHQQVHHYVLFYVSALECLICGISFMLGNQYPQIDFSANFLKLLMFIVICHLHWSLAARSLHREDIVQHVINPMLCLYVLYCTTVALMGMVDVRGTWTECMRPYWLMLSSADFVIVQMFIIVAVFVTYQTEGVSTIASFKNTQNRDLWSVIIVFEFSAVLSVTFDAVMRFVGSETTGCSSLFGHTQLFYSTVVSLFLMAKFMVPTWTILCVFQPVEGDSRISEVALASRYNLESVPNSNCSSIRGYHQYRRMFLPDQDNGTDGYGSHLSYSPEFSSIHGDYSFPVVEHEIPLSSAQPKKPASWKSSGLTVTGLSTISEESGNLPAMLDSPTRGSVKSEVGIVSDENSQVRFNNVNT